MRRDLLKQATKVAGIAALLMLCSSGAIFGINTYEHAQMSAHLKYNEFWLAAGLLSFIALFIAGMYTLFKAMIAMAAAAAPDGAVQRYLDNQLKQSVSLEETIAFWKDIGRGLLTIHRWGPRAVVSTAKGLLMLVLITAGMVACTYGVFSAGSAMSSWPSWAVVIVILLAMIAFKK